MILDETRYDPLLPPQEQGVGAWNRGQVQVSVKRKTATESSNTRSRKLRRVASSKLGDQNEGIWGDIIGGGFSSSEKVNSVSLDKGASFDLETKDASITQPTQTLNNELLADLPSPDNSEEHTSLEQRGFLQGYYFYIHGFSSKQVCHFVSFVNLLFAKLTYVGGRSSTPSGGEWSKYCAASQ